MYLCVRFRVTKKSSFPEGDQGAAYTPAGLYYFAVSYEIAFNCNACNACHKENWILTCVSCAWIPLECFFFKLLPLILALKMRVVSMCSVINRTDKHPRSWCDATLGWGSEIQHPMNYSVLPVIFLSLLSYLLTFMYLFELIWPDFSKVFDI